MNSFISFRQGSAFIITLVLIVIPLEIYCDYRISLGSWPLVKLLAVAGLGGGVAFALWVSSGKRRLAIFSGVVAGIGAVASHVFLLAPLDQCVRLVPKYSSALLLLGAVPGFLLFWIANRAAQNKKFTSSKQRSKAPGPN
ncbi:MAG: hypothetical protein ABL877_08255 [Thiobacillus sp.]